MISCGIKLSDLPLLLHFTISTLCIRTGDVMVFSLVNIFIFYLQMRFAQALDVIFVFLL